FVQAGCGGSDGGAEVPTAGGGKVSATAERGRATDDVAAYVKAQRAYATCLREHGVDAPDPDAKGTIDFGAGDQRRD
ncbi:hypothetical protein ACPXCX_58615, partial [Streptomyces sp. DT225]